MNDEVKLYSSGTLVSSATVMTGEILQRYGNDSMYVSSGGVANSTTVNSYGYLFIDNGGLATSTTVNRYGNLYVSSGGVANSTTVNSGGYLSISSGGVANNTTINYYGSMLVSSGGVANSTTVDYGGRMHISSGGVANSNTVNSSGYLYVYSGGTANSNTVNQGGDLCVWGGVASSTTVNSYGSMHISSGGTTTDTTVNSGGYMSVSGGGTTTDTTVNYGGYMSVSSGGTALSIKENGGYVSVDSNANATFTPNSFSGLVLSNARATLHSGTTANSTTVNDRGSMSISSGGVANSTTVNGGFYGNGSMVVSNGGVANSTTVNSSGYLYVSSGGVANDTSVSSGGRMDVGGVANNTTVNSGGRMDVGGVATSTTVNGWSATLYVSSGGVASSTTVNYGGYMSVSSGGVANSTTVNDGGYMIVSRGGTALSIKENGGYVYVDSAANVRFLSNSFSGLVLAGYQSATLHSGTTANSTTVNSSGYLYVSSGGVANDTSVSSGGRMDVGGVANNTTVNSGGRMDVGGVATSTTINSGGNMSIFRGGVADSTTVNGGNLSVYGGVATSTTVNADGSMVVSSGGVASSTTVNYGGMLSLSSGGRAIDTEILADGQFSGAGSVENLQLHSGARIGSSGGGRIVYSLLQQGDDIATITGNISCANHSCLINGSIDHLNLIGSRYMKLTVNLSSGDTATNAVMNSRSTLNISSGGIATSTTVNSGGAMTVSGGTATSTTVNSGGWMAVCDGGVAIQTMIYGEKSEAISYGSPQMTVSRGGVASATTINSYGVLLVDAATAVDTEILSGGILLTGYNYSTKLENLTLHAGAMVASGTQYSRYDQYLLMQSGDKTARITGTLAYENDRLLVSGSVDGVNLIVNSSSYRYGTCALEFLITSGGSATDSIVGEKTLMMLESGASASSIKIIDNAPQYTRAGSLTLSSGGFIVGSGAIADQVTADLCGAMQVVSGGTVTHLLENGGCVIVDDGAQVEFLENTISGFTFPAFGPGVVTVHSKTTFIDPVFYPPESQHYSMIAEMIVFDGGTVVNPSLLGRGVLRISGGFVDRAIIGGGGNNTAMMVYSGLAQNTHLAGSCVVYLRGGTLKNTTVDAGGILRFESWLGGISTHSGTLVIQDGGIVTGTYGVIDFTVAEQEISTQALITHLDYIPTGISFTLTVKTDQSCGVYVLATDAMNFSATVSVKTTEDEILGDLVVNGAAIEKDGQFYRLTVDDNDQLLLSIQNSVAITITAGSAQKIYDGTALSGGYECSEELKPGDVLSVELNSLTDAGCCASSVTAYQIMRSDIDVTNEYTVSTFDGFLTVDPRNVTLTSASDTKLYDGTPLTNDTITVSGDGFVKGEGATYTVTGSQTEIGSSLNTFTYTLNVETKAANYNITKDEGILTVMPAAKIPFFVTGDFAGVGSDYLGKEGDSDSVLHIYQTGAEWGNTPMEENWKFYDSVDFNGDGKADLLRSNTESKLVVGEVSNGNGSFTPQVLNALGDGWQILGTGDFNGNGVGDVLVANPTAASATVGLLGFWEGGTAWNLINGYSAEWEMVSTNDFNGDGKTDMLWKNEFIGEGGKTYNAYCTWIVDNANDWRMVSVANPEEWNFLCTGDFNGDNTADIAMINGEGVVGIWGIQDGYLSSWSILSAVDTNTWNLAGSGDFNGDGTDDIAWCNADTNLAGYWQINNKQLTSWQTIATLA